MKKTRGDVESSVSNAMIQFEKEFMGRGPEEVKTHIFEDMIFVRLKGVLTRAEQQLIKGPEGIELIKKVRMQLLENAKEPLYCVVKDITGLEVITLHTDISTTSGERIIIFTLSEKLNV